MQINFKGYNSGVKEVIYNRFSFYSPNIINTPRDKAEIRSFAEAENERLKTAYGIKSDIKTPDLLTNITSAVRYFCEINKDTDLFKGLEIEEKPLSGNIYEIVRSSGRKGFKLILNSDFDGIKQKEYTERMYNKGEAGCLCEDYYIYKGLSEFLNFKYNPYAYEKNEKTAPAGKILINMQRLCNPENINDFNSSYIAAKMCGEKLPEILDDYFSEFTGNTDLLFPAPVYQKILLNNSMPKFSSLQEAENFLKTAYGINADFSSIRYADECIDAAAELTKAANNKDIFDGLKIITDASKFSDTVTMGITSYNADTKEAVIYINPAYNIKDADRLIQKSFNKGEKSSNNLKNTLFVHEMSHWLDFKGNPEKYYSNRNTAFNEKEQAAAARVSSYAAANPHEFCAEYISGRLAGFSYPEITNKLFEKYWNGIELKFAAA